VAVLARREVLFASLVDEIESTGGGAQAVACNVTDRRAMHEAVASVEAA